MIVFHTIVVVVFLIRLMYLHQNGYTWATDLWHKSIVLAAVVTNLTAIITTAWRAM